MGLTLSISLKLRIVHLAGFLTGIQKPLRHEIDILYSHSLFLRAFPFVFQVEQSGFATH